MQFPEHQIKMISCDCGDLMHTLKVEYWDDDVHNVDISVMMPQERPFWKRIIPAIRYLFNLRGKNDWHYTSVSMRHDTVAELQRFLHQYQTDRDAYYENYDKKTHKPTDAYKPQRKFSTTGQNW